MKLLCSVLFSAAALFATALYSCNGNNTSTNTTSTDSTSKNGGFPDQIAYGHHLVEVIGCNDCHTPKKMTAMGPVPDTTLMLSGHPVSVPPPNVNRNEMESKGLAVTNDLTAWVGPWGISYAANLTPDETGIGSWSEGQFIRAIREGKSKGLEAGRQLLPPMPWQSFALMKDEELKAIFAYLKSIKPINNVVPPPAPPVTKH
ncbi:MAG: diheme cytochrome c-553 [Flavisolibacter sp.]